MGCKREYCFACKQVSLICDGICSVCGTFHEDNNTVGHMSEIDWANAEMFGDEFSEDLGDVGDK